MECHIQHQLKRKILVSILLIHSYSLICLLWWRKLSCEMLYGERRMRQSTKIGVWSTAHEDLIPSVQLPEKNWILPTTTWASLKMTFLPVEPWDDCSTSWHLTAVCEGPEWEDTIKVFPDSTHTETWDNKCCFKPLFWGNLLLNNLS